MNKEEWNTHCKAVIDTMTSAKQFIKDEIQCREGVLKDTMNYATNDFWTEEDFKEEVNYVNKIYGALDVCECMIEMWSERIED